ncbi:F-box/LRR-repeat protein At1g06630 [Raphanus sativus]|uniref:F-box/LRR-repeat protein At1g06630 n=1 Tax=Raphanus sativus TaxID=3726 RepID=A0A6J0LJM4_RAPSA|nr:F-box/LRR-repeat protein At1g06630 [Raphanus sativus]
MTGNTCEKEGTIKEEAGLRDLISWLPEEVLGSILSLLPTKQAASTSVLAKKWRHVFKLVHNLDFDDYDVRQPEEEEEEEEGGRKWDLIRESFRKFVDAFQCASPIKKFSLKCHFREKSEMAHVNGWICNALARGVLEMSLDLWTGFEVFLPCALLTSKTLVKLTLGSQLCLGNIPPGVSLPALKSLFIDSIFFTYGDLCNVLLPGCPVLEELSVLHVDFVGVPFFISSRSIKKLSVSYKLESEITTMPGMSFHAPNLVSLNYSDYALEEYPQVDLESLVQAWLNIHYSKLIKRPDMSGLINGISNVHTLHLTPASTNVISRCVKHGLSLPMFKNLINLIFWGDNKRCWKLLPCLIKQSPNLCTLLIHGLDEYTCDGTMHLVKVKGLHLLAFGGTARELEHLMSILGGVMVDDGHILQTHDSRWSCIIQLQDRFRFLRLSKSSC